MRKCIFFIMFFFVVFYNLNAVSPSKHELVPAGHWVYDAITALALETGSVNFAQNAPLSFSELSLYLKDINTTELSRTGLHFYDKIHNYFQREYPAYGNNVLSFGTDLFLTPEFRYISNSKMYNENEMPVSYVNRNKLIEIPLLVNFYDYGVMRMGVSVASNYESYKNPSMMTNIPTRLEYIDGNFPQTSYLSTGLHTQNGTPFFNFQLGQNQLSVGRTQTGSIFLSDSLYGANYAQMSFFSENVRYSNTPMQLESELYLYLHRIEFRLFERVSVGLLEGLLVSRPFELRYLNPVSIFHSLVPWANYEEDKSDLYGDSHTTSYFGLTLDINPWKYLRLYALMAMNQFTFNFEYPEGSLDNTVASSLGGQLGLESFIPIKKGYIHAAVEGVYGLPWLYKNKETNPSPSFYNSTILLGSTNRNLLQTWIGYPYGPDTISAFVKIGYNSFDFWSAYIHYRYMINGEVSFSTPYPTQGEDIIATTPFGIPNYEHKISVEGSYRIFEWLTVESLFSYIHSTNAQNVLNNFQQGVEFSLCARFELSPVL